MERMGRAEVTLDGDDFETYVAVPDGPPRGWALVLIHEIWGLVDHIRDVADRLAGEGYLVMAPDVLSEAGITPQVGAELIGCGPAPIRRSRPGCSR